MSGGSGQAISFEIAGTGWTDGSTRVWNGSDRRFLRDSVEASAETTLPEEYFETFSADPYTCQGPGQFGSRNEALSRYLDYRLLDLIVKLQPMKTQYFERAVVSVALL